jgi:hypothetical protein
MQQILSWFTECGVGQRYREKGKESITECQKKLSSDDT